MYATYRQMANLFTNYTSFDGNSVRALWDGNSYKVYSYETLILKAENGKVTYFDNSYFSPTTSKVQNILIDVYYLNDGKHKRD